jgi:hypothetical protein
MFQTITVNGAILFILAFPILGNRASGSLLGSTKFGLSGFLHPSPDILKLSRWPTLQNKQNKAKQKKSNQNKAKQNKTRQSKATLNKAKQSKAKHSKTNIFSWLVKNVKLLIIICKESGFRACKRTGLSTVKGSLHPWL